MKVYNLACEQADHRFEGWFGSEQDFVEQQAKQMLSCPLCGSLQIKKLLSAPRLNLTSTKEPSANQVDQQAQAQASMLQMARELIANTEDVGERFYEEARRMHYQEAELRNIRGVLSQEERVELQEEGIEVLPLPNLDLLKEKLQ